MSSATVIVRRGPVRALSALLAAAAVVTVPGLSGCATRAADVQPAPVDPAAFADWPCARIHDEMDAVQQRAVDLSWTVDERAGQHVVALGIGLAVFWPALLAMRPDGAESDALARLKGRHEALQAASLHHRCAPPIPAMPPERAAALPVLPGERLVYEDRTSARESLREQVLTMVALRRDEIEFSGEQQGVASLWRQDLSGNVIDAPPGALAWRRLLRRPMVPGDILAGEIAVSGDASARARVRGQVLATGPQTWAGRSFDVAVIELFGDVSRGDAFTRLDGVMVVDRISGLLLRLDLNSAQSLFQLQRRLVRVDGR